MYPTLFTLSAVSCFTDYTVVEEVANSSNRKSLREITFISTATVEYGGLSVAKNDTVNLGEAIIDNAKQNDFILKNTGVGKLLLTGNEPVKVAGETGVFSVVQPSSSEIAAGGSLPFRISFNPKEAKEYTATVTIGSNDERGNFTFSVRVLGT
jgi:hypothetical protein